VPSAYDEEYDSFDRVLEHGNTEKTVVNKIRTTLRKERRVHEDVCAFMDFDWYEQLEYRQSNPRTGLSFRTFKRCYPTAYEVHVFNRLQMCSLHEVASALNGNNGEATNSDDVNKGKRKNAKKTQVQSEEPKPRKIQFNDLIAAAGGGHRTPISHVDEQMAREFAVPVVVHDIDNAQRVLDKVIDLNTFGVDSDAAITQHHIRVPLQPKYEVADEPGYGDESYQPEEDEELLPIPVMDAVIPVHGASYCSSVLRNLHSLTVNFWTLMYNYNVTVTAPLLAGITRFGLHTSYSTACALGNVCCTSTNIIRRMFVPTIPWLRRTYNQFWGYAEPIRRIIGLQARFNDDEGDDDEVEVTPDLAQIAIDRDDVITLVANAYDEYAHANNIQFSAVDAHRIVTYEWPMQLLDAFCQVQRTEEQRITNSYRAYVNPGEEFVGDTTQEVEFYDLRLSKSTDLTSLGYFQTRKGTIYDQLLHRLVDMNAGHRSFDGPFLSRLTMSANRLFVDMYAKGYEPIDRKTHYGKMTDTIQMAFINLQVMNYRPSDQLGLRPARSTALGYR